MNAFPFATIYIFSYQSNANFYVMSWKQSEQDGGDEGINLKAVKSETGPGEELGVALWKSGNTENQVDPKK